MKKTVRIIVCISLLLVLLICSLFGCGNKDDVDREVIAQVSLLQGLLDGDYYGSVTIGELKTFGDIGIGTFDKLNGELIMIDGVVYRAKAEGNGLVEVPKDDETIPFSNVTFFDVDYSEPVVNVESFNSLVDILNAEVQRQGVNNFYFVRIDGVFNSINARSEYPQEEPYKKLVDVLAVDQVSYSFDNIEGTIVALYCPEYMKELNNFGWHMHFVSKDKTVGGHLFDVNIKSATIGYDYTTNFAMKLPNNNKFKSIDFSKDRQEEVESAETNK